MPSEEALPIANDDQGGKIAAPLTAEGKEESPPSSSRSTLLRSTLGGLDGLISCCVSASSFLPGLCGDGNNRSMPPTT